MNYGEHKLYLYQDTVDLVINTDGLGIYVDNRPMNIKKLQAHKGVTNEIFFTVRNRDRKLQNVFNETIRAYIVSPTTRTRLLTKIAEHTADVGKFKLTFLEGDLQNIDPGLYHMYVTRSTQESVDKPVFTDQNNNVRFDIEISEQAMIEPVPTQEETNFTQVANTLLGDTSNIFVSSAMYGNVDRNFLYAQHTIGIYTNTFTGNITIQGSCLSGVPEQEHDSIDWFNITTKSLSNTNTITHETFSVNANWIRIKYTPDDANSTVTKVMLRN